MRGSLAFCFVLGVFVLAAHGDTEEHHDVEHGDTEEHHDVPSTKVTHEEANDEVQDEGESEETEDLESVWDHGEQLTSDRIQKLHKKVDANNDGKVSLAEIMDFSKMLRQAIVSKEAGALFEEMDQDKDGKISLDELIESTFGAPIPDEENLPPPNAEQAAEDEKIKKEKELEKEKFKVADKNKDGFLDKDELPAALYPDTHDGVLALTAAAALKDKDKDHDGELSPEEFWENQADESENEEVVSAQQADFEKLDLDKNGKLNLDEFKKWESGAYHTKDAMDQLFVVADEDADQHLTLSELDNARPVIANSGAATQLGEWAEHYEL